MPKVIEVAATTISPPEAAAVAVPGVSALDDVEVPPLPPILPNNDDDDAKIAAATAADDGEEGAVKPAAAAAAMGVEKPAANEDGNNSEGQTFYAVRVGYAACASCSSQKDGDAASSSPSPPLGNNGCSHVSTIRSAIFLRWEDVQQFVEFQEESSPPPAASATGGVVNVPFHYNVEYKEFNDMDRALKYLQKVTPLSSTTNKIRSLHRNSVMPIPPLKNFNPPTKKWESMYQSALEYKSTHGHLNLLSVSAASNDSDEEKELIKWVKYQRTHYKAYLEDPVGRNHSMTIEKVNRLKEAGFDWIVEDKKKWLSEETASGKRKRGRPRKSEASSEEEIKRLKKKQRKEEERKSRPIRQKWLDMLESLTQYKATHGTVDIPEDNNSEEHKELKLWLKAQQSNYIRWKAGADVGMSQEKADLLTALGMEFAPSWDEMFAQVVAYKSQHGHIKITSEENDALASWMLKQNHVLGRHLMGMTTRLKKEQISRLMNVGFEGGRTKFVSGDLRVDGTLAVDFDAKWHEMFGQLQEYKNENGHCNIPTSAGTDLSNWVAAQRRMYGKLISGKPGKRSFLDASKMQRLTDVGFQFRPRGSYYSWEEQMAELKNYKEVNGDCKVPVNHERLGSFVKLVRRDYKKYVQGKKCGMSAAKEAELQELGFVFEGGKTPERKVTQPKSWEERYEDLIRYKEQNGDTVVPQNSGRLGQWVHAQRVHYKKFKKGEQSQMTAEKALKLSEIGFCFDAADRFRGSRTPRQPDVEEMQVPIPDVPPALGGSFY